jgi:uncharacterized membrane protein
VDVFLNAGQKGTTIHFLKHQIKPETKKISNSLNIIYSSVTINLCIIPVHSNSHKKIHEREIVNVHQ